MPLVFCTLGSSYTILVSKSTKLISSLAMLNNKKTKTLKLKNENSFLKNSCEEHDVLKSSYGELKLTHETLV